MKQKNSHPVAEIICGYSSGRKPTLCNVGRNELGRNKGKIAEVNHLISRNL
ncbi:MAG: hypothetical protein SOW45_07625 [Prevotella sp.]|nr:hypothetical protein [Prevotella sp.]